MLHAGVDSVSMDIYRDFKLPNLALFYERCLRELEEVKAIDPKKVQFIGKNDHII